LATPFQLAIVSPERILCEQQITSLVVPGGEGYLGILAHHAPIITTLQVGEIKFRTPDNKEIFMATSGGFMEVSDNKATILVDTAEYLDEIDYGRAQEALQRAEGRLNLDLSASDRELAVHSRDKAKNRLAIIRKHGQR